MILNNVNVEKGMIKIIYYIIFNNLEEIAYNKFQKDVMLD